MDRTLKAGVIGLGVIGGGVAVCLARAARPLAVFDIRRDASAKLEGVPAVAASPAAVARDSDVVMIAVVDAAQARDVLEGPQGILSAARPGLCVVLLSTVALSDLRKLEQLCQKAGVTLIDCGVTGGTAAAQKGLVSLVGGEKNAVERIRPVLEDFSKLVLHMGPFGAGMAAKIARNIIPYSIWRATYESALLAEKAGVDLAMLSKAIESSLFPEGVSTVWLKRGTVAPLANPSPEEEKAAQAVAHLLRKDLEAAKELADQLGLTLPVADITRENGDIIFGLG